MTLIEKFVLELQYFLSKSSYDNNVIRIHSKKLDTLGDISFPLNIKNWSGLIKGTHNIPEGTIFDYTGKATDLKDALHNLTEASKAWCIQIKKCVICNGDIHIFLDKKSSLFHTVLRDVLHENNYGCSSTVHRRISIKLAAYVNEDEAGVDTDLTTLRLFILRRVTLNLLNCLSAKDVTGNTEIILTTKSLTDDDLNQNQRTVLCGPVLDKNNHKSTLNATQLFAKRSSDMRMMAQHKYGMRFDSKCSWKEYFEALGRASVTFEMLSSKPQKSIKLDLNDLQVASKGPCFVFYNCARLNVLLQQFNKNVQTKIYPELPDVNHVDFSLLSQPEEWELFYVYILQYPLVIKRCIKDIENSILNVHNLVVFLSNLAALFSSYYRRVKILIESREHLFPTLYARIYLLKSIQYVFHHALFLMDIEPIKEM